MISFKIDGQPYRIEWEHIIPDFEALQCVSPTTNCYIYDGDIEEPVWFGQAVCAPGDKYVKETGRKISLQRALQTWPRELRKKVWTAYFSRNQRAISLPNFPKMCNNCADCRKGICTRCDICRDLQGAYK